MDLPLYGSLEDPIIQSQLEKAKAQPQGWTVYLVKENSKPRTQAQNRLYHAFLSQLAQTHGRSVQYWNDLLVERFLGWDEVELEDGYIKKVRRSTRSLNVSQFSQFMTACMAWAAENTLT